jgi:hypothetical protein
MKVSLPLQECQQYQVGRVTEKYIGEILKLQLLYWNWLILLFVIYTVQLPLVALQATTSTHFYNFSHRLTDSPTP